MLALAPDSGRNLRLPERSRTYRSTFLDSRNWDHVTLRPDDVVISASCRSGGNWMQNIVQRLVFLGQPLPALQAVSPWVDDASADPDALALMLADQPHRRVLKSHLALDGLPYDPEVRYIVVVRDARDAFMAAMNRQAQILGRSPTPALARCWDNWINRGQFPGDTGSAPSCGTLHHARSWWAYRRLENILFVHFNDLLGDPATEIGVISEHLGVGATPADCAEIAKATTLDALPRAAGSSLDTALSVWQGGQQSFVHRGINGRWREVLTASDLHSYEIAKARVLTRACAAYTEQGRRALW